MNFSIAGFEGPVARQTRVELERSGHTAVSSGGADCLIYFPGSADELKKLARLAVETGVDEALMSGSVDQVLAAVAVRPNGKKWIDSWNAAKNPWFHPVHIDGRTHFPTLESPGPVADAIRSFYAKS